MLKIANMSIYWYEYTNILKITLKKVNIILRRICTYLQSLLFGHFNKFAFILTEQHLQKFSNNQ